MALFAPEHGLATDQDARIGDGRDAATGLPVFSLYGERFAPIDEELAGIDTLVFDLPDVGTRFFTYASTLHASIEVAAARGSGSSCSTAPTRSMASTSRGPFSRRVARRGPRGVADSAHGMTMGELGAVLRRQRAPRDGARGGACGRVGRDEPWSATGLPWIPPSPNRRSATEALLYPGIGLLEATNVSVGRGTATPVRGARSTVHRRPKARLSSSPRPGSRAFASSPRPSRRRATSTTGSVAAVSLHGHRPGSRSPGEARRRARGRASRPLPEGVGRGGPGAAARLQAGHRCDRARSIDGRGRRDVGRGSSARFQVEREKYLLYPARLFAVPSAPP